MLIRATHLGKVLGICALLAADQATAACIGISQPLVNDTSFRPLLLKFSLHATNRVDGVNFVPDDQTFIEEVRLDTAILPANDSCNQRTYIKGQAAVESSPLGGEIAGHFGAATPSAGTYELANTYGGYSSGPLVGPQNTTTFSITVNGPDSLWSSSENRDIKFDHWKSISLGGSFSGFSQDLDVLAFLMAQIGAVGNFSSVGSTSTWDYRSIDPQYGYFGTATLLSVTQVPVPGAAWLFSSALLAIGGAVRRKAKAA